MNKAEIKKLFESANSEPHTELTAKFARVVFERYNEYVKLNPDFLGKLLRGHVEFPDLSRDGFSVLLNMISVSPSINICIGYLMDLFNCELLPDFLSFCGFDVYIKDNSIVPTLLIEWGIAKPQPSIIIPSSSIN